MLCRHYRTRLGSAERSAERFYLLGQTILNVIFPNCGEGGVLKEVAPAAMPPAPEASVSIPLVVTSSCKAPTSPFPSTGVLPNGTASHTQTLGDVIVSRHI